MIRIIKPSQAPDILVTEGKEKTDKICELYEQFEQEFQMGKKKFEEFDKTIYGHKSLKDALKTVQHHKCCFCERKEEIGDVEHFRPKSAYQQKEGDKLSSIGYYWLAYDWHNLFFACPTCNRTYKRNLFPLVDPTKRAKSHKDNLAEESPLFIHPQDDDPEKYIEFIGDKPRAIKGNPKGKITIEKTGIDRPFLGDEQRFTKYQTYKVLYQSMRRLQSFLDHAHLDPVIHQEFQQSIIDIQRQLADAQQDEAEFASMIRCAVKNNFRF